MINLKTMKVQTSLYVVLASLFCFTIFASSLEARDYDFSLEMKGDSALILFPGATADFYVDFENSGDMEDSYMFYCMPVKESLGWNIQGCFDFKGVCWGSQTMNPETFAAGAGEEVHIQIFTPQDPGTIDGYLKVVSEATGTSQTVYYTVSNETSPAIRTLVFTNKDHYKAGDTLVVSLRNVNLGEFQNVDTYVAVISGPTVLFFKMNRDVLELSADVGPYKRNNAYFSGVVSEEVVLSLPLETSLGIDNLIFASVMANAGTTEILTEISSTVVTFE